MRGAVSEVRQLLGGVEDVAGVALPAAVARHGGVAGPQRGGHRREPDRRGVVEAVVADAAQPAVPAVDRQPHLDADRRLARGPHCRGYATEGREARIRIWGLRVGRRTGWHKSPTGHLLYQIDPDVGHQGRREGGARGGLRWCGSRQRGGDRECDEGPPRQRRMQTGRGRERLIHVHCGDCDDLRTSHSGPRGGMVTRTRRAGPAAVPARYAMN